jgi:hypothetical protein
MIRITAPHFVADVVLEWDRVTRAAPIVSYMLGIEHVHVHLEWDRVTRAAPIVSYMLGIEHVHVHSGGQAVVGLVEPAGGRDRTKLEDQPHARQIADAQQPEMRCPQPQDRAAVPKCSDGERSMPDARRTIDGGAEG